MFSKVLVANRGEIAVRVIRGAQSAGYQTVAVYSDADADALHVKTADQAVHIGPSTVAESYLVIDKLIAAAKQSGADAIHPGYGFLAENADFARACSGNGITFIGPTPEAIDLMGSKRLSKAKMIAAGVPCVPGSDPSENQTDAALVQAALDMGLPVMVKASAGGGGRGMRLVHEQSEIENAIESARAEAISAFGNGELIVEKAVIEPRHVEIQVFADNHGNVVHLGERDCSVQRRHQKLIEESPSPAVDEALRAEMGAAAVQAAASVNYRGAGTVEFLLDKSGEFYFLEMNTRLQVEHPVTELVTGTDLVAWQLLVAAGEILPLTQEQISLNGWAIEVRLCAESPADNFLPQTGKVIGFSPATGEGIRFDHCLQQDGIVSPFYDSMQGKLIAHGPSRAVALRRLRTALANTQIFGLPTNRDFLGQMLAHPQFASGEFSTAFIEQHFPQDSLTAEASSLQTSLAALALYLDDAAKLAEISTVNADQLNWNSGGESNANLLLKNRDDASSVHLKVSRDGQFQITVGEQTLVIEQASLNGDTLSYVSDGIRGSVQYARDANDIWIDADGIQKFTDASLAAPKGPEEGADGRVLAPMDGSVMQVLAKPNQRVAVGDTLVILEAMKMEMRLTAKATGVVKQVEVAAGDVVKQRQLLVFFEPDEE